MEITDEYKTIIKFIIFIFCKGHVLSVTPEGTVVLLKQDLISVFNLDAAFKILNPKAVPKFFRLNSHNAILEFLLEVQFFITLCIIYEELPTGHIYRPT